MGRRRNFGGVLPEELRCLEGVDQAQAVEGKADCSNAAAYEPACAEEEVTDAAVEKAAEGKPADGAEDVANPSVDVHRSKQRECSADKGQ